MALKKNYPQFNFIYRHWVSKHFQDFEQDATLRSETIKFLETVTISPHLLPVEIRAASQLLRLLYREDIEHNQIKLQQLLTPSSVNSTKFLNSNLIFFKFTDSIIFFTQTPSKESIETLSALEIAEQMTYLDHQIFINIRSE